jgi:proline iminopeptidase
MDAVIYDCPAWDFTLSTKSSASFLMPYFNNISLEKGANDCLKIIEKDYTNRSESFGDLLSILNQVKDESVRNYLHGTTIEEYRKYFENVNLPPDSWQKTDIHLQKLVDAGEIFNDYLPCLKEINQPSLLLVGKYDPVCAEDQRDYFRQFVVRGTVVEFLNSGHFSRIEEPQKYTESIINFLEQCFLE